MKKVKGGVVYIMTNKWNSTLYTGVTSNLASRNAQHKTKFYPNSFSARYNLSKLVFYETHFTISEAIAREKQIKAGSRAKKVKLIEEMNPEWKDLTNKLNDWVM